MRYFTLLMILLVPMVVSAQDWEDRQVFGESQTPMIRVLSSTDTAFFAPIIENFIATNGGVSVEYLVTGTADIDRIFRGAPDEYDIVISSAMDLQFKLANDGFAAQVAGVDHPHWAQWRDSLFAFTTEPAAIVINRTLLGDVTIPSTRQELIELLRAEPERFAGKIGTYDVRHSGLGYLFATQDARATETYWRLMEVLGRLNAQLYCCSGDMIDDLIEGRLLVAYNVLGSYAQARAKTTDDLVVILPSEFPTTMMRTALVSEQAPSPSAADAFLRHLLRLQATPEADGFPLPALSAGQEASGTTIITLDPALLTYLDQMKRQTFIREWENALVQDR